MNNVIVYYTSHINARIRQSSSVIYNVFTHHNCNSSSIFYIYYSYNGLYKHYTFSDSRYSMMYSRISLVCSSSTCFCLMCIHRSTCDCRHTRTCEDQASSKQDTCDCSDMSICHSLGCKDDSIFCHRHTDTCVDPVCNMVGIFGCSDMNICHSLGCKDGSIFCHRHTGTCVDPVCNMVDTSYRRHTGICMDRVCNMLGTSYHRRTCICMDPVCNMLGIFGCSDMNICSSLGCSSEGICDYIHIYSSSNQICMDHNIFDMYTCNHAGSHAGGHKLLRKSAI